MGADGKKTHWVGSSHEDLLQFPESVKRRIGFDIRVLQDGDMPEPGRARQMQGFTPAVIELRMNEGGDTYRCVVTVRLKHRVYILHAFKKKSTRGARTPQPDIDLINERLRWAQEIDAEFDRAEQAAQRRGA